MKDSILKQIVFKIMDIPLDDRIPVADEFVSDY
jgi:hypothetical protein